MRTNKIGVGVTISSEVYNSPNFQVIFEEYFKQLASQLYNHLKDEVLADTNMKITVEVEDYDNY